LVLFLISSNFIVFSFSAVAGLFSFFTEAPADENKRNGEKDRTESERGWQGASGGAVSDKLLLGFGLARRRRMSPSDRGSPGRRASARMRHSGEKTRSDLEGREWERCQSIVRGV